MGVRGAAWASVLASGLAFAGFFVAFIRQGRGLPKTPLRLEEFKPRVLTSFVRNQLIDEVYLPIIGDNLAKQIGAAGAAKAGKMGPVLDRAAALADQGVILRGPVPKAQLVHELAVARALLYRGDMGETFCSAVAEAQAMGVPAVLQDIACMRERVIENETGWAVGDDEVFAKHSIAMLSDDGLWRRMHRTCLERQRSWGWDQAVLEFERIAGLG
jgi:glycosyltransferase involved in cell wall biosynthesis